MKANFHQWLDSVCKEHINFYANFLHIYALIISLNQIEMYFFIIVKTSLSSPGIEVLQFDPIAWCVISLTLFCIFVI